MNKSALHISRLMWLLFLLPSLLQGQLSSGEGRSQSAGLLVDYASFASDSAGDIRLELYCRLPNKALQFQKTETGFVARYELAVSVKGDRDRQLAVASKAGEIHATSEQQAMSAVDFRIRQFNFDLPPGKYRAVIRLTDENSSLTRTNDLDVKLRDFDSESPGLSDIELVRFSEPSNQDTGSFTKGDLTVIPSVTGNYGGDAGRPLQFYLEVYQGQGKSERARIETILRPGKGRMIYRDSTTVEFDTPLIRQIRQVSLTDFPPGDYELVVLLKGRRGKKLAVRYKDFHIAWSVEAALRHDFQAAVDQLSYIASNEEIQELKRPKTFEDRLQAFQEFWLKHDPTPETPENELKSSFYHRITIANQRFTAMGRSGWQTDRGRIYIQYGEPDQIEDNPIALSGPPYQYWHYYRHGSYRKFTFVDEHEDGDYRLLFPYDGLHQRPN
ncbi:MAG: GWxTD domain-containing protein [bacterium]